MMGPPDVLSGYDLINGNFIHTTAQFDRDFVNRGNSIELIGFSIAKVNNKFRREENQRSAAFNRNLKFARGHKCLRTHHCLLKMIQHLAKSNCSNELDAHYFSLILEEYFASWKAFAFFSI